MLSLLGSVIGTRQETVTQSRAEGTVGASAMRGALDARLREGALVTRAVEGHRRLLRASDRKQWCPLPWGRLIGG